MARAACRIRAFLVLNMSFIATRPVAAWGELCACLEISSSRRAFLAPWLLVCGPRGERAEEPGGRRAIPRADGDILLRCDCVPQAWRRKSGRPAYWPRNTNSRFSPDPGRRAMRLRRGCRWDRAASQHEHRCCTVTGSANRRRSACHCIAPRLASRKSLSDRTVAEYFCGVDFQRRRLQADVPRASEFHVRRGRRE